MKLVKLSQTTNQEFGRNIELVGKKIRNDLFVIESSPLDRKIRFGEDIQFTNLHQLDVSTIQDDIVFKNCKACSITTHNAYLFTKKIRKNTYEIFAICPNCARIKYGNIRLQKVAEIPTFVTIVKTEINELNLNLTTKISDLFKFDDLKKIGMAKYYNSIVSDIPQSELEKFDIFTKPTKKSTNLRYFD